uniref:Small ribosomal subunit protein mS31 n=1 Tax=Alona affinis TaxID=381656 RepID=A0A9N6WNV5_9CRUS|nr:EOG090X04UC [Alona affinis]
MLLRPSLLCGRLGRSKFVSRNLCGTNYLSSKDDHHDSGADGNIKTPDSQEIKQKEAKARLDQLLESMTKESSAPVQTSKLQLAMPKLRERKPKDQQATRSMIEPEMLKAVGKVADTYTPQHREVKKKNLLDKLEAVAQETAENKAASFQREKLQDLLQSMNMESNRSPSERKMKLDFPDLIKGNTGTKERSMSSRIKDRKMKPELNEKMFEESTSKRGNKVSGKGKVMRTTIDEAEQTKSFKADKETTAQLNSILNTLQVDVSSAKKRTPAAPKLAPAKVDRLYNAEPIGIFAKATEGAASADLPVLHTWEKLYQRELELAISLPPANGFQQMIQWTKQGKMWHFPINNEQGLEVETDVGFHEHVFLEPHLDPWCPKRGPIRHFMELVTVGLSKNPYMTLETKLEHILWFRDFFDEHRNILVESGAMVEAAGSSSSPPRVSA